MVVRVDGIKDRRYIRIFEPGNNYRPAVVVSHYRVERRSRKLAGEQIDDWGAWQVSSTDTNTLVKGLERGVEYDFRVVAINAGGASVPSKVVTSGLR